MSEIDVVLSSKKILMISNEFMTTADIAFTTVAPPHPAFSLVRASVHALLSENSVWTAESVLTGICCGRRSSWSLMTTNSGA
jgi:dienelactone hydrolase